MLRINTPERRKLYCVVCCSFCKGCFEQLLVCIFCFAWLPCLLCCKPEDSTSKYNEDTRMFNRVFRGHYDTDSDDSSEWSDDSSQWFTARGLDKDNVEELKPLVF